jgi:predicted amidohydrolase
MGITHPKFKAAVVQAAPVWLDLEGTVAKTITYIEGAARAVPRWRQTLFPHLSHMPRGPQK